ncbi:uncharacterized protein F5891DRAFT_1191262 [Suillus fuscotomentosus]|uniref:Integrase core domain-containing protein n=1 Tax=Suillus fuscotomentosus TaxID=1912939 RepID=A0AAD4E1G7_9AGAM|nr:uncharacterized protein F5891DRAFT_1191262 [Suillus fuscotomentosus]KAG1897951.1 hypothetical protein F5891DRAFT_1191262 [Suillus fuscotomentosus]
MPNQNKPTPPLDEIAPHILRLWKACQTDRQIIQELQKHIDTTRYGIGLTTLLKVRKTMGLQRTRQQHHTVETIHDAMLDLRATYPNAGAREMVSLLYHEREMSVARRVVTEYFALYEPELVLDQHDKWLRFGLGLHTGIEPFSGRIMWTRVWHSNRNPQLILSYYLNTIEALGHMPMVTQSDPGSENYGIANAHTMLRQYHDKALHGTLQHRWMRTKKNVMPEIAWSQLRRRFTPGFENLLDHGVNSGWYDSNNTLQVMVFRWVFIPWLQQELDAYQDRINNTAKRHDRNKILPHGVPNLIYHSAEDFGALDFKIQIEPEALDFVRSLYIKPSHCVFDLVPEGFGKCIQHCYNDLGRPVITQQSVWDTYRLLLDALQLADKLPGEIQLQDDEDEDFVPLLDDYQDLPSREDPNGAYYMGGVGGGLGLDTEHCRQLDVLSHSDEPDITTGIDESLVGLDHAGLVVWEFSDCESDDEMVDGW